MIVAALVCIVVFVELIHDTVGAVEADIVVDSAPTGPAWCACFRSSLVVGSSAEDRIPSVHRPVDFSRTISSIDVLVCTCRSREFAV